MGRLQLCFARFKRMSACETARCTCLKEFSSSFLHVGVFLFNDERLRKPYTAEARLTTNIQIIYIYIYTGMYTYIHTYIHKYIQMYMYVSRHALARSWSAKGTSTSQKQLDGQWTRSCSFQHAMGPQGIFLWVFLHTWL